MIKICSWNIQAGGGARTLQISRAIVESKADIIALSEYRNNEAGNRLRSSLLKYGYRHQTVTNANKNDNSVLIVSKFPFESRLYPESDATYPHNIVGAMFDAFLLVSVYLPHKKKHNLIPYLTNLVRNTAAPVIIVGDYNTGINHIDQDGNSFWYTTELKALRDCGMTDAFRLRHKDVKEYSWYSHQGNGYRYDHTYIDSVLKSIVHACYYDHTPREDKVSDHSPMYLELG